jgi:septal ring factor EnvC (AmiA/AmiB activator)
VETARSIAQLGQLLGEQRRRLQKLTAGLQQHEKRLEEICQLLSEIGSVIEDLEDRQMLKEMRKKPLKFRRLDDFLREERQSV